MTDADLLKKIKSRIGKTELDISEDALLLDFLDTAKTEILSRRFPYGDFPEVFPTRYESLAIRLAVILYNRIGAEGETSHSENGVSRSYEEFNKLLYTVVPMVGGIR